MPTVPALEILLNFNIFSKFTKFHQTFRTLESSSETCMWNLSLLREVKFFQKKACIEIWNFTIFAKFTYFIKLAEHIGIIIRNMQVKFQPIQRSSIFSQKNADSAGPRISWNFNIFSKFTNFHQTCRTYWNHHQKHACEIWAYSEKLNFFIEKCLQCRPFKISWNFNIFSKFT